MLAPKLHSSIGMRSTITTAGLLASLLLPLSAAASPVRSGLGLGLGPTAGINNDDDAEDFEGTHPEIALQVAYRFALGTEPFVILAPGLGGRSAFRLTYGGGVRQRLRLARAEPYIEGGFFWVGDDARAPIAFAAGAGLDVRLGERWSLGAGAGHYFSEDDDDVGGLDWYVRGQLTYLVPL